MIPKKLFKGAKIRVCSPSRSMKIISQEVRAIANQSMKEMSLTVTYSKNSEESNSFLSSKISSRIIDLHEAFSDKNIDGILTTIGGFNSNQLLKYLDYNLIKKNPKIICGYSDITALNNAIYAKTGLVTYLGPHYSTFGMKKGNEYTIEYFKKCLFSTASFEITASPEWSDDEWYLDQENRTFFKNEGMAVINNGKAKGTLIGGNIGTFALLQGTEFIPSLKKSIILIEDDSATGKLFDVTIDRQLQSLIHQPEFDKVRGIIFGRAQKSVGFTMDRLREIISTKKELNNVPIIANVDFGHTTPMLTMPIGGKAEIEFAKDTKKIKIIEH